jgi:predicted ArsR family transcriptional regulator
MHYNTTGLQGQALKDSKSRASTQEALILMLLEAKNRPMSPSEIFDVTNAQGLEWPITSIRRAMTNLTISAKLIKCERQRPGLYGRPEHLWQLSSASQDVKPQAELWVA